jgi:hypothetical protein
MEGLYFTCPVCGEDVPRKAKSCPECGACEKSGWGDTSLDGLDLPDGDYMTGRMIEDGRRIEDRDSEPAGLSRFWIVVAIVVLIAMAWLTLRSAW